MHFSRFRFGVADAWWPRVLESLRRHAEASHFTADGWKSVMGEAANLGDNAPEDHSSGSLDKFKALSKKLAVSVPELDVVSGRRSGLKSD